MTASNFAHLELDFPAVHKAAVSAESLALSEPEAAAILAGKAVELALTWAFAHDAALTPPAQSGASRMINDPDFRALAGRAVHAKMRLVNRARNTSAHEGATLKPERARQSVEDLHHILHWFGRTYARRRTPPEPNPFDPAPLSARLDAIRAALARTRSTNEALEASNRELEDLRARYADLDAELAAKRAEVAQARAALSVDPHDYDEAATRARLIDALLEDAGWTDLRPGHDLEVRVEPMPNERGHGFADYVLWGEDGLPLAVIEAKRTRRSASEGQQQARLYADALEAMYGRRPVIFYTNGYEHWIWDDARGIAPRRLGGFKTARELAETIARRAEARPLSDIKPDPAIAGRPYQTRALTRIAAHFDGGARKALLVMATGTGKTRTVVALVDMMVRAGLVKRALFLCDRISLARQARTAFAEHMPDSSPVNLVTDPSGTGRVYVSTYPTMMNLIDRAGHPGTDHSGRRFGPGHFDLVIVDEAHRSVYKRYRAIFDWFDSHLVGLTATPRDEVDRDTYRLFDLDPGHPTDFYGLEEAIADGFLVPFEPLSLPTRFMREGIRYDDLSDAEKDRWDELDWGEDGPREAVTAGEINTYLFNADTVDKVLAHVMAHGIRVAGGDRIGKTIVFAANKPHAAFIEERFNAGWPNHGGDFARRIVHGEPYAQRLIEDFEQPDKAPQIAISVDMLDTGVDVPDVVNLVFFKLVRSKTKFWQMVGRGTRLRPALFGPGEDKAAFRIFDVCGNLEFFGSDLELSDPPVPKSLTERLVAARLKVARAIEREPVSGTGEDADLAQARAGIVDELRRFVAGLDPSSFVVRGHLRAVEAWQAEDAPWSALSDEAVEELTDLAALPSGAGFGTEEAKRFDLVMFELQLGLMGLSAKGESCRRRIVEIATALSTKREIPAVARHGALIEEILADSWWEGLTVPVAERARLRLREIVHLIDRTSRGILYTDFEDDLGAATVVALDPAADFAAFKQKARAFLSAHGDHVTLRRLRTGRPLTALDIGELERMLVEAGVGSDADIEAARETQNAQVGGFGVFLRSVIGLDRSAAQEHFADFIADGASADQIEFVGMVIEHLTRNGVVDPGLLYETPFTDLTPDGPDGLFPEVEADRFLTRLRGLNRSAEASDATAEAG